MGKGFNKLGEFNYIYKSSNVFCASNPFLPNKISIFQINESVANGKKYRWFKFGLSGCERQQYKRFSVIWIR